MTIYLHVKIKQLPSEAKIHSERVENILLKPAYPKIWVSTTFLFFINQQINNITVSCKKQNRT